MGGTSNGADHSRREREGAFGNAVITAEVRNFLIIKHYSRPGSVQIRDSGVQKALGALDVCSRAFGPLARPEATPSPRCPGLAVVRESGALS